MVDHPALGETDREQLTAVLVGLRDALGRDLIGAYLHGSAVLGGLRARSDLDLLAVATRRMTRGEKERLVARLLLVSGPDPEAAPPRPIELTVVVASEIRPWRYPPSMDLLYGEWWREEFENGDLQPWGSRVNRDGAILVSMALRRSRRRVTGVSGAR
jgi:streptomycin 3"-adenylyltransferase